ncbi:MAG: hypothetical protein ABIH99_03795 [Candidatus Micrarchaeota archaeon]
MIMILNSWQVLLAVFFISFLMVFVFTPLLIRKLRNMKMLSADMNKKSKPMLPKMGGITIMLGFILATLVSLQLYPAMAVPTMLASICTISLIAFLGMMDDVLSIRDLYRVVLPTFAALPLMAVSAGTSWITLPFIGVVKLVVGPLSIPLIGTIASLNLYALLLIPIGVVACSNLVNMLAGFNGLEVGSGAVISLSLLLFILLNPVQTGSTVEAAILLTALLGACIAFLFYNWHPAKLFPGNITTYVIGAVLVCAVVIGNMERVGVIALIPQIIEFFLKARGFFKAENFGEERKGRLYYEGKVYSLTHLFMKYLHPTEKQLVVLLLIIQAIFGLIAVSSLYW